MVDYGTFETEAQLFETEAQLGDSSDCFQSIVLCYFNVRIELPKMGQLKEE